MLQRLPVGDRGRGETWLGLQQGDAPVMERGELRGDEGGGWKSGAQRLVRQVLQPVHQGLVEHSAGLLLGRQIPVVERFGQLVKLRDDVVARRIVRPASERMLVASSTAWSTAARRASRRPPACDRWWSSVGVKAETIGRSKTAAGRSPGRSRLGIGTA